MQLTRLEMDRVATRPSAPETQHAAASLPTFETTVTLGWPSRCSGQETFVGEEALATVPGLRLASATAITACSALKIGREDMVRVMREEHEFSDVFVKFMLARSNLIQADVVHRLFNCQ